MGSKGSNTVTSNQTQTYSPNQQIGAAGGQALTGAESAAQLPFQMPQAPVAPFTPFQNQAFNSIQNLQGFAQPYFNLGSAYLANSAAPVTGGDVANYYNPMAQNVTAQMQNIFGQQNVQNTGSLTQAAGGVGADRIAVGQANLANQQGLAAGQTYAGLYQQALQAAEQNKQMQAGAGYGLGQFGPAAQAAQLNSVNQLLGAGGMQQQLAQQQMNSAYQQQLAQIAFPYQQPQYLAGITAGLAPAMGGTTTGQMTTTYPQPSGLAQMLGLGTAAIGGLGSLQSAGNSGVAGAGGTAGAYSQYLPGGSAFGATPSYQNGGFYPMFDSGGAVDGGTYGKLADKIPLQEYGQIGSAAASGNPLAAEIAPELEGAYSYDDGGTVVPLDPFGQNESLQRAFDRLDNRKTLGASGLRAANPMAVDRARESGVLKIFPSPKGMDDGGGIDPSQMMAPQMGPQQTPGYDVPGANPKVGTNVIPKMQMQPGGGRSMLPYGEGLYLQHQPQKGQQQQSNPMGGMGINPQMLGQMMGGMGGGGSGAGAAAGAAGDAAAGAEDISLTGDAAEAADLALLAVARGGTADSYGYPGSNVLSEDPDYKDWVHQQQHEQMLNPNHRYLGPGNVQPEPPQVPTSARGGRMADGGPTQQQKRDALSHEMLRQKYLQQHLDPMGAAPVYDDSPTGGQQMRDVMAAKPNVPWLKHDLESPPKLDAIQYKFEGDNSHIASGGAVNPMSAGQGFGQDDYDDYGHTYQEGDTTTDAGMSAQTPTSLNQSIGRAYRFITGQPEVPDMPAPQTPEALSRDYYDVHPPKGGGEPIQPGALDPGAFNSGTAPIPFSPGRVEGLDKIATPELLPQPPPMASAKPVPQGGSYGLSTVGEAAADAQSPNTEPFGPSKDVWLPNNQNPPSQQPPMHPSMQRVPGGSPMGGGPGRSGAGRGMAPPIGGGQDQSYLPYPDATHRDWGQNMTRSPWMALVNAGATMAQAHGPIGSVIGQGIQAGSRTLDQQRAELRNEEQINQKAQALHDAAQRHLDAYTKMTPAQRDASARGWEHINLMRDRIGQVTASAFNAYLKEVNSEPEFVGKTPEERRLEAQRRADLYTAHYRDQLLMGGGQPGQTTPLGAQTPGGPPSNPQVGDTFQFKQGLGRWDGKSWVPVQ